MTNTGDKAGVTLIELVVAMSIAGIVVSLALASWTLIAKHTALEKHKTEFQSQAEQTGSLIVNAVRNSDKVLLFGKNAITFVDGRSGDTVSYSFDADTLRRNGTAVPFVTQGTTVVRFSVEKDEAASAPMSRQGGLPGSWQDMVLCITVGMQDRNGATSEIAYSARVRFVPDEKISF
jgi:prepilin-type N-terminal cleavage/methylation domain-containing protein